jgi:hypothetical protein
MRIRNKARIINKSKKAKVFIGPSDNVGNAMYIARSLRSIGIDAHSFSFSSDPTNYELKADFPDLLFGKRNRTKLEYLYINRFTKWPINFIIRTVLLYKCLFRYNTFIFISPVTIYNGNLDLPILGFFRKKIAIVLLGCAERDPSDPINHGDWGYCKICTDYNKQKGCLCTNLQLKKDRFRLIERHSNYIFAEKDLVNFVKNNNNIFPIYVAADPPKSPKSLLNKFNNSKIVIAHLPTNNILKGSKYVIEIMDKLCNENPEVEFVTQKMSNKELLLFLENEVHIIIDELHSPYHGLLAVEAMARGCIVLTRVLDYFFEERPELPIISVNPNSLEVELRKLLRDKTKMVDIAERSIEYYYKYHTLQSVGSYYKRTMGLKE